MMTRLGQGKMDELESAEGMPVQENGGGQAG